MTSQTDQQLLMAYAGTRSEPAFAELVRRHLDLVYSTALRLVHDAHEAQDVSQAVFLALAQQAQQLTHHPVLSGWLHRTTQNLAANAVRTAVRRQTREQEAAAMNPLLSPDSVPNWEQIAPHLDAALGELSEPDRDAVLLRYFERKSAAEMAQILGVNDDAAQKRVSRAVERLREYFTKHGVTVGAGALTLVIPANAVQAAPVGLATTIAAAAILTGTTATTATTIAAAKIVAMTTLQKIVVAATVATLAGVGIYQARHISKLQAQIQMFEREHTSFEGQIRQLQSQLSEVTSRPTPLNPAPTNPGTQSDELLKLRGEVAVLRRQASDAATKAQDAERNLAEELSAKAQFFKNQGATINATKQLGLAMRLYMTEHGNHWATNILQMYQELDPYTNTWTISGIDLWSLQIMNTGITNMDHPNMTVFRERLARQAPDGTWQRAYGFADGSVQIATSYDGNFDAWEKANTYIPPANTDR